MSTVTLSTLRTLARERADMAGSAFVADSATGLDRWINEGVAALHQKLVAAYGEEYVETTGTISVTAGTTDYNLPSDFFKLYELNVDVGGRTRALKRFNRAERNTYRNSLFGGGGLPRYRVVAGKLRLEPASLTASVQIRYAPQHTSLVNNSDSVTFPNTWEQYAIVYAAVQALVKEESGTAELVRQLEKWDKELDEMAAMRDLSQPLQAVDVDNIDYEYD